MSERALSGAEVRPRPPGLRPSRAAIEGEFVRLEPLEPDEHAGDLYASGHAGEQSLRLWRYLPYGPFRGREPFLAWLGGCATSLDPLFFAVCERRSGRAAGMASLLNIRPVDGVLEIGHVWFAPRLQRTRASTEATFLLLRESFETLGCRRVEWKCDALNEPSRNAALRLGFRFEGIFYRHLIVKTRNRDTAWFSMLSDEWPGRRAVFERWLAPENFDAEGRQRAALRDFAARS
ncbi:MAG: GNAT family N-acetyltransferase [Rhodospirillales bacterium]|nr:GNAT family N-acetyltransferase [Rhodospirillales bacterium]